MTGALPYIPQAADADVVAASNVRAFVAPDQIHRSPYVAKVWWAYDQITPAVIASQGVSSITDDATGVYTVNFSSAFASTSYAFFSGGATGTFGAAESLRGCQIGAMAVGSITIRTKTDAGTLVDAAHSSGTCRGTLA